MRMFETSRRAAGWMRLTVMLAVLGAGRTWGADSSNAAAGGSDPLLDLFVQKGFVTQAEAEKVKAEADLMRTNGTQMPPFPESKWKISDGIKNVDLFGDVRLRYEGRTARDPEGDKIRLDRYRYSLRVGLRGEALDDFDYGFRLETSANPRSSFDTFGTASSPSSSNPAYNGPYGKSTAGIALGQIYLGWRPWEWVDLTVGKMPNPLYTTTLVWNGNISPEGAAEQFKYTVGPADFFANFGQFLYQDMNPISASGLLESTGIGPDQNNIFQIAWQAGLTYHISTNISAKAGATIYSYYGLKRSSLNTGSTTSPYYGDPYVGEGTYTGPGSGNPIYGYSGYGAVSILPGYESLNYPNNQVGLNNLLVLELPFELDFKISRWNARVFGDYAYNLEGKERAEAAQAGYTAYLKNLPAPGATIGTFAPQTQDVKAWQAGFAIGSQNDLGLVNGTVSEKHAWEFRTYWQHIEQYSLDPNLLDTDFFEGQENLEGIYAAFAYGFSRNVIGTVRYGHASRINKLLGTGGTGQDIPQMNPINSYRFSRWI